MRRRLKDGGQELCDWEFEIVMLSAVVLKGNIRGDVGQDRMSLKKLLEHSKEASHGC